MLRRVVLVKSRRYKLVIANVVPSLLILFTLMTEAMLSCEVSVLTRVSRHHIPEDGILQLIQMFTCS
jgi:hypothetical protein